MDLSWIYHGFAVQNYSSNSFYIAKNPKMQKQKFKHCWILIIFTALAPVLLTKIEFNALDRKYILPKGVNDISDKLKTNAG